LTPIEWKQQRQHSYTFIGTFVDAKKRYKNTDAFTNASFVSRRSLIAEL